METLLTGSWVSHLFILVNIICSNTLRISSSAGFGVTVTVRDLVLPGKDYVLTRCFNTYQDGICVV